MVKITKVNWKELDNLGKSFGDNTDEFIKIKGEIKDIINSLNDCWRGIDSYNYRRSFTNYLNYLDRDIAYLDNWSSHFKKSSLRYSSSVESGLSKVKNLNKQYEINNDNMNLFKNNSLKIGGSINERQF